MKTSNEIQDLRDLAEAYGLDYVETTSELSGYPRHIKGAIIGFDSFKKAQEIADEYGLSIETLRRRDGSQLYSRTGNWVYEPFRISAETFGCDLQEFTQMSEEDFIEQEIESLDFTNFESLEEISNFINRAKSIFEEIEALEDDEFLTCTHDFRNSETYKRQVMSYHEDVYTWAICLIDNEDS